MTGNAAASLVNLLGFITGAILYGMLLWMVMNSRPAWNRLALLTGVLGLAWNLGTFLGSGLSEAGLAHPIPLVVAAAFGALCFLPSVVVHSVVRTGEWGKRWNLPVVFSAYLMSGVAAIMHFHAAITFGSAPSQIALRGLTVGFGIILIGLLLLTRREQGWARTLWVVALSFFAISALHLSYHEGGDDKWWLELIGHNASVPLAIAILYQDYRFAFADIFLKRALGFILLVSLVFGVYLGVSTMSNAGGEEPTERGILLILAMWIATALVYPSIRRSAERFVDKVVLRRVDYGQLLTDISRLLDRCETPSAIMDGVASRLTSALTAPAVTWRPAEKSDIEFTVQTNRRPAIVPISTIDEPQYVLLIGELSAGRRLLSDDVAMLERVAFAAARRIDAVRAFSDRYERDLREQEMRKLTAESELRALRAQMNPHFLFNALTTIGYLIQTSPDRALGTLMRLSGLLRSVLRTGEETVTLGEELDLIEAYLEIERARFEDRLRVKIDVPWELRAIRIPALILQPLVENAIKHGISSRIDGGEVHITGTLSDEILSFAVVDTGVGAHETDFNRGRARGVGLDNVERRLQHYGGESARLVITSSPENGTRIEIHMQSDRSHKDRLEKAAVRSAPVS